MENMSKLITHIILFYYINCVYIYSFVHTHTHWEYIYVPIVDRQSRAARFWL